MSNARELNSPGTSVTLNGNLPYGEDYMPWSEPMAEKPEFVDDALSGFFSRSELCERHGISRKTGYKHLRRYRKEGPECLRERSRRPKHCPHQVPDAVVEQVLHALHMHPRWGAFKVPTYLNRKKPEISGLCQAGPQPATF